MEIEEKTKKLLSIWNAVNESITKKEFLESFRAILEQILDIEKKLIEKIDSKTDGKAEEIEEWREKLETLSEEYEEVIENARIEGDSTFGKVRDKAREMVENYLVKSGLNERFTETIDSLNDKNDEVDVRLSKLPTDEELLSTIELLLSELPEETPEEIRDKLESIEDEEEKLKIEAVSHLREELDELKKSFKRALSGGFGSGGGGSNPLSVPLHESFTMNGSDTSVTLSQGVAAQGTALFVRYQGQTLDLTTHYTVNGNKITFVGFTPEVDTIISVTYWIW